MYNPNAWFVDCDGKFWFLREFDPNDLEFEDKGTYVEVRLLAPPDKEPGRRVLDSYQLHTEPPVTTVTYWSVSVPDEGCHGGLPEFVPNHATEELALTEAERVAKLWPLYAPTVRDCQSNRWGNPPWSYIQNYDQSVELRLDESSRRVIVDKSQTVRVEVPIEWRVVWKWTVTKTITGPDGLEYSHPETVIDEIRPWAKIEPYDHMGRGTYTKVWKAFYVNPEKIDIRGVPTLKVPK